MISPHNIPGTHDRLMEHGGVLANAEANCLVLYAPFDCKLDAILFIPDGAMSHHDSNYCVLDVIVNDVSLLDEPFSFNDSYGDLDALEELVLDCNETELDAGDIVILEVTQESSGLAISRFNTVALFKAR